jgi:hypothetical protein
MIRRKKKRNNLSKELLINLSMKKVFFILGLCLLSFIGFAQLEINAELRPRGEARHGYKNIPKEDTSASIFISQRTRLNLYYTNPKFKVGFSIQDVRVWGDEQLYTATGAYGDNASLDLNEGWIEIFAGKYNSFKIGRQYWVYEDERMLARRNWNQSSIKYDGFLYKYEAAKFKMHLGLSLNNNLENLYGNDYNLQNRLKTQNFLNINKKINDRLDFSFQALATGYQKKETANTIYVKGTYGLYAYYKPGKFAIKANGFYQNGKNIAGEKVSAYFASLRGDAKLDPLLLDLGVDYHSGQDAKKENNNYQETDHLFDLFYGGRHQYYGYMDLFDNISKSTAGGGLVDLYAGFKYKFVKKTALALDYHYFSLQSWVLDPSDASAFLDKPLGSEFDFTFEVPIISEIVITGGFSAMLPTISMEKLQGFQNGGNGLAYWGWCMITAKPTFFKSEK